jgi:enoyl-CoA hydratase/carnithine racemase
MTATTSTAYTNLRLETRGAVTVLTVHRPEVLNALNRDTLLQLDAFAQGFAAMPRSARS